MRQGLGGERVVPAHSWPCPPPPPTHPPTTTQQAHNGCGSALGMNHNLTTPQAPASGRLPLFLGFDLPANGDSFPAQTPAPTSYQRLGAVKKTTDGWRGHKIRAYAMQGMWQGRCAQATAMTWGWTLESALSGGMHRAALKGEKRNKEGL